MVAEQSERGGVGGLEAHLPFRAGEHGVLLAVFDLAVTAADVVAGVGGIDEVIHLVAENAEAEGGTAGELAQGDLGVVGGFLFQIDVTQLDGAGRRMRAVGVEFLGTGQALRTGQRSPASTAGEGPDRAGGHRSAAVVGIRAAIGIDVLPFVTQAEFVAPGAGGVFFQQEQTVVAGQRLRHVGLLAEGFEVATQGLCPEHAAPAEQRLMGQLQAGIGGVVVEASAHFPAFDLLVLVIAVADTQPCQFKARQRIAQLAAQIPAFCRMST